MPIKTIDQNPSITDTVLFDLPTTDTDGCLSANPYMVNQVIIYYVERSFTGGVVSEYEEAHHDPTALAEAQAAKVIACNDPTPENIADAQVAQAKLDANTTLTPIFYNEATPVQIVGNAEFPAWLSTDLDNAFIENVGTGLFQYTWQPLGMREGDYFICWTWTMLPAGTTQSAHTPFKLAGDTAETTSIPTHQTAQGKYQILLERYLPEMFKMIMCPNDLSPETFEKLNNSVALGFTDLENLGNQIVDLQDANSTAEAFLPLLARLFDLRLKSDDPTRWRRQIKRAVPLFKKKGTIPSLQEAFAQAGMNMTKLTKMWQVVSPYTWQEELIYTGESSFVLSQVALGPVSATNYAVGIRHQGDNDFTDVALSNVSFTTSGGETTVEWLGTPLVEGDSLLVLYLVNAVPNPTAQLIENYIRTLPLADQRDERDQEYPLKNWNVRMIEEDDPMFGVVIPNRFPYHDELIFGKIRTEFAYSENIYGMEEYDGSLRNSKNPCDIDKEFIDICGQCQGSKYTIDLEIQNLSNDRLLEAQDILKEFAPFHAVLHSINFSGGVDEFMQPPVETIECLIQYTGQEQVIAGGAQLVFGRAMFGGLTFAQIKRDMLATTNLEVSTTGTAYNDSIMIYCPEVMFDRIGMRIDTSDNIVEILAPSPLAGKYYLSNPVKNNAEIHPKPTVIAEPINKSAFTFRLSNDIYMTTSAGISRDNLVAMSDANVSFSTLGVVSDWDIDHGQSGGPWMLDIPAYGGTYTIHQVLPDGSVVLNDDPTLPTSGATGVSYTLLTDLSVIVATSTTGSLAVTHRGMVDLTADGTLTNVRNLTKIGDYVLDVSPDIQYEISGFLDGQSKKMYILGWNSGTVAGRTIRIYDRLADNQIGYLNYSGQKLQAGSNLEASLGISNGTNPPGTVLEDDHFMESFLVSIGSDYYEIAGIDQDLLTIIGPKYDWKTLAGGGTSVSFNVYRYIKESVTIQGQEFDFIDRRGKEIITQTTQSPTAFMAAPGNYLASALNAPNANEMVDAVAQSEKIGYTIEYADGSKEKGEI